MTDLGWLSTEALRLHDLFTDLFYTLVAVFLVLGVVIDYFRLPLGGVPTPMLLVARASIALLLLHAYPEIANTTADIADALAQRIGDMHSIDRVLEKMSEKLSQMTVSWLSVKESISVVMSFVGFFLLYFSVYVTQGLYLFTWALCFVFSPVLIAFFVLPATSSATVALFRTIFEVSCWKIMWSALAVLLWSSALNDLQATDVNFVALVCMNLALAGSLLLTPVVVHVMASSGVGSLTRTVSGVAVGAAFIKPAMLVGTVRRGTRALVNRVRSGSQSE